MPQGNPTFSSPVTRAPPAPSVLTDWVAGMQLGSLGGAPIPPNYDHRPLGTRGRHAVDGVHGVSPSAPASEGTPPSHSTLRPIGLPHRWIDDLQSGGVRTHPIRLNYSSGAERPASACWYAGPGVNKHDRRQIEFPYELLPDHLAGQQVPLSLMFYWRLFRNMYLHKLNERYLARLTRVGEAPSRDFRNIRSTREALKEELIKFHQNRTFKMFAQLTGNHDVHNLPLHLIQEEATVAMLKDIKRIYEHHSKRADTQERKYIPLMASCMMVPTALLEYKRRGFICSLGWCRPLKKFHFPEQSCRRCQAKYMEPPPPTSRRPLRGPLSPYPVSGWVLPTADHTMFTCHQCNTTYEAMPSDSSTPSVIPVRGLRMSEGSTDDTGVPSLDVYGVD